MEQPQHTLAISSKRKDVYRPMAFEQRERWRTEERSRFDDQILTLGERSKQAGEQHQYLATLPIGQPDPIPERTWRKRDTHGRADRRALTAGEIAERGLKLRERRDKKQQLGTSKHVPEEWWRRFKSQVHQNGNLRRPRCRRG
jgi:hypothetical protein